MTTVLEPELPRNEVPEASDRSFGLVFAGFFALVGGWPLIDAQPPRWWALVLAAAFATIAAARPALLHHANRTWLALGRLVNRVMSPLVMGAVFFLCVTPIAMLMRLAKKDVLSLARRRDLASYWITRPPAPPIVESMRRQF